MVHVWAVRAAGGRSSTAPRTSFSSAITGLALALAGCEATPQSSTAPINEAGEDILRAAQREAEQQAIQLKAQQGCMTGALNDTIFKQQSDSELETAFFKQNLSACPTDFVAAFVQLRLAARNYLQVSREILSHQGQEEDAYKKDGLNILCSIVAGSQCAKSFVNEWETLNVELKDRAETAQAALESAKANIETVIAQYGLYVRTMDQPSTTAGNAM